MADEDKGQGTKLTQEQPYEALPKSCDDKLLKTNNPEKTSWPELVGVTVEEAKRKIKEDMPEADIVVVPPDTLALTLDFVFNRVRLFVDESDKITRTPMIG